jgi:thiamine-monophosphate kinase
MAEPMAALALASDGFVSASSSWHKMNRIMDRGKVIGVHLSHTEKWPAGMDKLDFIMAPWDHALFSGKQGKKLDLPLVAEFQKKEISQKIPANGKVGICLPLEAFFRNGWHTDSGSGLGAKNIQKEIPLINIAPRNKIFHARIASEFQLIDKIQSIQIRQTREGNLFPKSEFGGIGDDCALLSAKENMQNVFTCDTIWEGVHFNQEWFSAAEIGAKGLTAAYSDLAAKGITGGYALVTLALPSNSNEQYALDLYHGIFQKGSLYGVELIGGNTLASQNLGNARRGPLMLDFFLMGQASAIPLRKDARAKDLILTTAPLGLARAGLSALKNNLPRKKFPQVVKNFISPEINPVVARFIRELKNKNLIQAAMDISDGLAGDLNHILRASHKNAHLFLESIFIHPEIDKICEILATNPLELILSGGEEYVPLFTIRSKHLPQVEKISNKFQIDLYVLGEILEGPYDPANPIKNLPSGIGSYRHLG